MIFTSNYLSPVGNMLLAENNGSLTGLWIKGQKYYCSLQNSKMVSKETPIILQTKQWLDRYFAKEKPLINELSLCATGSNFRRTVWQILCEIPYGTTKTYGEIAKETAKRMGINKMSAQAIGGAVGHNPISVIIPCHRVVGANGSLTGYAAGIAVKTELLLLEGVNMNGLFSPEKKAK